MLDLFLSTSTAQQTSFHDPAFSYLRAVYKREIADVINYYQSRVYAVKNNHILIRLLSTLDIPMQYPINQYASVADTRAPYTANSFRMTSELTAGHVFDGSFYGPGCPEVLLLRESYFDPLKADKHWRHVSALQVHRHPQSHLGLLLPNGRESGTDTGMAVISINLALLAVQFRAFVWEQDRKLKQAGMSLLGVNHFIHMHVLPNMLYRHFDYVLMNRLMNLYYGAPMGQATRKHPFLLYDYQHKLDQSLGLYLKRLEGRSLNYSDVLKTLPAVYAENQEDALQLPDYAPTRQVQWALVLSRLPVIQFLIDLMDSKSYHRNQDELNALSRLLTRLERDQSLTQALPPSIALDVQMQLSALQRRLH